MIGDTPPASRSGPWPSRGEFAGRRLCGVKAGGAARVDCDEHGRFEIPAIAAGMATLDRSTSTRRRIFPACRRLPRRLVVRAGQTTEVAIPMNETVAVRGSFREKGTNRPIAGVFEGLAEWPPRGGDRFAVTDAQAAGSRAGSLRDDT